MILRLIILSSLLSILMACGEKAPTEAQTMPQEEAAAEPEGPAVSAALPRSESASGARVFFITPEDGATVGNPVSIEFGIEGMDVVKAGTNQAHSGHHHLLIDTGLPEFGLPIPADEHHVHFGDGSTATEITLQPGAHTLQMLLGDHLHIPHNPPLVSEVITITVE